MKCKDHDFFLLEPIFLHFHYFTFIPFEISQQKFINRIFIFYQKKIYFCQFFNLIIRISASPKLSLSGRRDLSSVYKVSFVKFKKWSSYKLSERNFFWDSLQLAKIHVSRNPTLYGFLLYERSHIFLLLVVSGLHPCKDFTKKIFSRKP